MNRRYITPAAVIAILTTAFIIAQLSFAANKGVRWNYNFDKAAKGAVKANKPILVDFYTDWCSWCQKLDEDTYSNSKVKALSRKFVCVKVNADKYRAITKKYKIDGYPTILFLKSDAKEISRVVGYQDAKQFLASMNDALKKAK